MFRISTWDESAGDTAEDLGYQFATEQEARQEAQAAWDSVREAANLNREPLAWQGPLAKTHYYFDNHHPVTVMFWVHPEPS